MGICHSKKPKKSGNQATNLSLDSKKESLDKKYLGVTVKISDTPHDDLGSFCGEVIIMKRKKKLNYDNQYFTILEAEGEDGEKKPLKVNFNDYDYIKHGVGELMVERKKKALRIHRHEIVYGTWQNGLLTNPFKIVVDDPATEGVLNIQADILSPNELNFTNLKNGLTANYKGGFRDGIKNGQGTYTGFDGVKITGTWDEGAFVEIQECAEIEYPDGNRYKGELHAGCKYGSGEFWYANGDHYKGKFLNNFKEGLGVFTHGAMSGVRSKVESKIQNGEIPTQEEQPKKDKPAPKQGFGNKVKGFFGKMIKPITDTKLNEPEEEEVVTVPQTPQLAPRSGYTYEGKFKEGLFHDENARKIYEDGAKYRGAFRNNQYHGKGEFNFSNGWRYEGTFQAGKFFAAGVLFDQENKVKLEKSDWDHRIPQDPLNLLE